MSRLLDLCKSLTNDGDENSNLKFHGGFCLSHVLPVLLLGLLYIDVYSVTLKDCFHILIVKVYILSLLSDAC